MYKISAKGTKILKTFHLISASCWIGGSVALGLIYFLKQGLTSQEAVYGINLTMHHLDVLVVIIPGAMGCLLTGLLYSLLTNWGFIKHKWIVVKWVITVSAILFGTFYLGPWIQKMILISRDSVVTGNEEYIKIQLLHFVFGAAQSAALIFAVVISVYKPWGRRKIR
ncbi:conserved hypothetical protein [Denitrovibrio acetiphilus DSM 12809]|uniref:DUF2269 domain-containing protein n=1 Tax=Denitrovibrio acetiphilus (strain DSM 12809 / NBRC 114555 / N2460) TaxID=522772 RepID=D4H609_DENA2|nr:hypothetical protein [Denitrovibrio acetiphilus]ADD67655.1 conserved hypothetical protein [Denitrovibrio acetiphilus DSM 12809]